MQLNDYFKKHQFVPNEAQLNAIKQIEGPLLIVAGPGSGKTRVLLWRTFNLIVFGKVEPKDIFLSTFTEKAAKQLKDGLLTLLGSVEDKGRYFDTSDMYVGTVHSLCRRILTDRRFNLSGSSAPKLLDKIDQYFHVYDMNFWPKDFNEQQTYAAKITNGLQLGKTANKHRATEGLIAFFNRLSEECITPSQFIKNSTSNDREFLATLYQRYLSSLAGNETETIAEIDLSSLKKVDMSLLQRMALITLESSVKAREAFQYVLIDEYQDTNRVQESVFFKLTQNKHNLCVVGDDDQSLYRFRGATVENIVQFENRCVSKFNKPPKTIALNTNYRSRPQIVDFYNKFIATDPDLNQVGGNGKLKYRLFKNITAARTNGHGTSVVTSHSDGKERFAEIADLVKQLIDAKKVSDANQIAFLYPSVKSKKATSMIKALDNQGISVYSPRSNPLLSSNEAKLVFGLFLQVFDKTEPKSEHRGQFKQFHDWLAECEQIASECLETDQSQLAQLLSDKKDQLAEVDNKKITWNLLDLFYEICACDNIKSILLDAEQGNNELAAYNLSQISQYIARYQSNHNISVIKSSHIKNRWLSTQFFNKYLYGLFRLGETEFEDQDNPFPKGKIPFLTIHQAKGLEFQVVVLGDMHEFKQEASGVEQIVRPLLSTHSGLEPINKVPVFDAMRMFYVALSRAQNLLVLTKTQKCHKGLEQAIKKCNIPTIPSNLINTLPVTNQSHTRLPKTYSYTADYQAYLSCPRHYMLFRKYGFAPARSRTMAFGVLVHKTIEDIHRRLLDDKRDDDMEAFIIKRFEDNFQTLLNENSHQLSVTHLEIAKQQALHYWKQNEGLARKITHTEVPLTCKVGNYSIYGVVDMALEGEKSELYDIKTHAAAHVEANKDLYQKQLNVYAKIWQDLHKKKLDGISIIATKLPDDSDKNLSGWNPVVPLDFDQNSVDETIKEFGGVVDQIEAQNFRPRTPEELYCTTPSLASELCSSCDGRFSCNSYRSNAEIKQEHDIVDEFVDYLVLLIKGMELNHGYVIDNRNKGFPNHLKGKEFKLPYLKSGYFRYWWKEKRFKDNKRELDEISVILQSNNDHELFKACLKCLKWGSRNMKDPLYKTNSDWLKQQIRQGRSVSAILDSAYHAMQQVPPNLNDAKRRAKLSRVLGKRALKSFHPRLFNDRLFAGETWSDKNGCTTRNQATAFC